MVERRSDVWWYEGKRNEKKTKKVKENVEKELKQNEHKINERETR